MSNLVGWIRRKLSKGQEALAGAGIAFLASAIIQFFTNENLIDAGVEITLTIGLALLIVPNLLVNLLDKILLKRKINASFWRKMIDSVPDYLRPVVEQNRVYAYGSVMDVRSHPHLKEGNNGWRLSELEYRTTSSDFSLPSELKPIYDSFVKENQQPPEKLMDDRQKISLTKIPSQVFTDTPKAILNWVKTRYSLMRFYQVRYGMEQIDLVESQKKYELCEEKRKKALRYFAENVFQRDVPINFPSSLAIHCLVVTKDNKLVIGKRSGDVAYYKNQWSPTIDENIAKEDLAVASNDFVRLCIERGLREELVGSPKVIAIEEIFHPENVRILSFLFEGSMPAVGICAYVPIELSWEELRLFFVYRKDAEFAELQSVDVENLKWDCLKSRGKWCSSTHFLLMMLKLYRGENPEELLP
jgi:hypothetical protein